MSASELILVTGGTGGLGRRVVARLRNAGRKVRTLSRRVHESADGIEYAVGDLAKGEGGEGVEAAVAGVSIVVHCAGVGKIEEDTAQARNLSRAAREAGVVHLATISVVGADRIPVKSGVDRAMFAYFASQLAKERVVRESGLPWTNLRATQFHDGFILSMVRGMSKLPIVPLPARFRFQPVDADEVADNLVQLALGTPAGQAPDIGGPRIYDAEYLLRSYLKAVGKRRAILGVRMPGAAADAIRAGANLTPDRAVGRRTWEEFLATEIASPQARSLKVG
ncbi:MAG TPA: NAD(P)H-binding protein [Candidatus Nitrosopolaris sp.]|nr:NAD(P)H-binding protein [Candidatus Nitrosopolaris sp.]